MEQPRRNVPAPASRPIGPEAFAPSDETALWWLGGAGFLLNVRGLLVAIDPAISSLPGAPEQSEIGLPLLVAHPIDPAAIPRLDLVLYTHSDADHYAPLTARALLGTGATFVAPAPVATELQALGLPPDRLRVIGAGARLAVGLLSIEVTPADHRWQLLDPARYGPPFGPDDCVGYLIATPDGAVWHPGDTVLLTAHLALTGVDVLLLDISRGDWHLGAAEAARLANQLGCRWVIPHHYGCYHAPDFGAANGDPAEVAALLADGERRLRVLAPGERFVIQRPAPIMAS